MCGVGGIEVICRRLADALVWSVGEVELDRGLQISMETRLGGGRAKAERVLCFKSELE